MANSSGKTSNLTTLLYFLILMLSIALLVATYFQHFPQVLTLAYLVMSTVTFISFAIDKRAAIHNRYRTAENTLHALELLGGWPGALLAQASLRHKSQKVSYKVWQWLCIVVHCAVVTGCYYHGLLQPLFAIELYRF
ncbi:DUF1294 domain-containing protein [Psychrobium sp. 1_MG-2023]|uniref:DUF1294 domain-containing protein n=1 Tax=Psychrobium sp. 1_MG-2023 TaxID=3062624 RepID=UPI000C34A1A7|nr:DUF1294 domain-containing protein [Psychrobium sp. 1_MG-2023]MDP2562322.1 DUF1294 domain-containing protein [Psychrobium sp. 1_MG-2023]PKF58068.1 DUF1294 domain-containing protein [Alteromonadales bacterium alter-6D02]